MSKKRTEFEFLDLDLFCIWIDRDFSGEPFDIKRYQHLADKDRAAEE